MVRRATKFTPQVMLSAPRRSPGIPNAIGTLVLYTTSTYSFETHQKTSELFVLRVDSNTSHRLATDDGVSDLNWLDNDTFAFLRPGKDGATDLIVASAAAVSQSNGMNLAVETEGKGYYLAGTIQAAAGNLKVKALGDGSFAVILSALASPDGSLYNSAKAPAAHSTGRLYTKLFVRHWDRYENKERDALWYSRLGQKAGKLALSGLTNVTAGLGLECPISTFGGTDNFDISRNHIIFVAKDPIADPALNTKCNTYLVDVSDWASGKHGQVQTISLEGYEGAASYPVFSHDGRQAAFLKMKANGYEADRNNILLFSLGDVASINNVIASSTWDRSPGSLAFGSDGSLLFSAEDEGTGKLFIIPAGFYNSAPRPLSKSGYVSDVRPLSDGRTFISGSSITDNSFYAIVNPLADLERPDPAQLWSNSNSGEGTKFGLKRNQVSSIWTPASNPSVNTHVHSLVIRPSNFDSSKKYPVAYLIHGGPQGSWADNWSTRWNPAVFAEQGYVAVAVNPTGSTGYGQAFTDAIRENWGGDPYQDIVNVFEYVGKNLPEADNDRAVALGASYGGYMMNWYEFKDARTASICGPHRLLTMLSIRIQGHDLGRKFKALVCHDGIFSFKGGLLPTEELYFPLHDLGSTSWYDPHFSLTQGRPGGASAPSESSAWKRWDPSDFLHNWSTPQLVIHSEKDYRLTVAEGLAAFNVLQARGVESQFLTFPDENHWVLKPENSLVWHKVVLNWINRFVGIELLSDEPLDSVEFFGGVRAVHSKGQASSGASMPTMGKSET